MALIQTTPVQSSWNCTKWKTESEKFLLCATSIVVVSVVVVVVCSGRLLPLFCHTACEFCAYLVFNCEISTKHHFFFNVVLGEGVLSSMLLPSLQSVLCQSVVQIWSSG